MNVENVIGRQHHRPKQTSTTQFGAVLAALKQLGRPDAVHVVHQLPALERPGRIERLVGLDVRKTHRERSDFRPHARIEQMRGGDHAADLVAVCQCIDEDVRAGAARLEAVNVVDADVAGAVGRQVARHDFERWNGFSGGSGFRHGCH
jgi:hypothetical protein